MKKKKYSVYLTWKTLSAIFLILLQLGMMCSGIWYLSGLWAPFYGALRFLSIIVALWLAGNRTGAASYNMAWAIFVLIFPLFGGVFYLLFGRRIISKKMVVQAQHYFRCARDNDSKETEEKLRAMNSCFARQAAYLQAACGFPVFENTEAVYCAQGEEKFGYLVRELEQAHHFIFLEYFIVEEGRMWNTVFDILQRKVREGVEVRLMYDAMGSMSTLPAGYAKLVGDAGIRVCVFNPLGGRVSKMLNYRDHRKICIIDGDVGFTGGINLADEYINMRLKHGHWKDTAVMLRGEAVWGFSLMFLQMWSLSTGETSDFDRYRPQQHYESDGLVQPYCSGPLDGSATAENAYLQMIAGAVHHVYITTPYLILDDEMLAALTLAARSGVDVRIITPHVPDKWYVHAVTRSFYPPLLEAGVRIYEYTPGFIHAKMCVCDGEIAMIGTANLDYRSFYLHFECGAVFYHSTLVDRIQKDFLGTMQRSQSVKLEEARGRIGTRLVRFLLRIFAPLM